MNRFRNRYIRAWFSSFFNFSNFFDPRHKLFPHEPIQTARTMSALQPVLLKTRPPKSEGASIRLACKSRLGLAKGHESPIVSIFSCFAVIPQFICKVSHFENDYRKFFRTIMSITERKELCIQRNCDSSGSSNFLARRNRQFPLI